MKIMARWKQCVGLSMVIQMQGNKDVKCFSQSLCASTVLVYYLYAWATSLSVRLLTLEWFELLNGSHRMFTLLFTFLEYSFALLRRGWKCRCRDLQTCLWLSQTCLWLWVAMSTLGHSMTLRFLIHTLWLSKGTQWASLWLLFVTLTYLFWRLRLSEVQTVV